MATEFYEKYNYKIKNIRELASAIGTFPREKKVIICHGVFDVVHPGHVRHLAYAKSKADILIASITCDRHIKKGSYRPHVPQNLRALNLAAFEMVDNVLIDENSKPLKNIEILKPDYFAKGFEYTEDGLPKATQEEVDLVNGYGGEVIFTPGDIVYSSSTLINLALPNIQIEKLLALMKSENKTFDDLRNTLNQLSGKKVHVVGDTIVDTYTRTSMIGGQTKTPTISVLYQGKEDYIGGAGIVAQHLRAAGAEVVFSTLLGNDHLKDFVLEGLSESGVDCRPVIDAARPTTNKNAIIAGGYRMLKIDTLDNRPITDNLLAELTCSIKSVECDAVVFSDFRHGIFNRQTVAELTAAISTGTFKVADSQVASRWGNITEFKEFDLVTPNEREARFSLADQESTVGVLAQKILQATNSANVILKLGERGVFTLQKNPENSPTSNYFSIDSFALNVVDPVGAGDALLAYATLSMLVMGSPLVSTILGSIAAACECERDGNIPISVSDVATKIDAIEKRANFE